MKLDLEGKVAIVTGNSKGIGLAITKSLESEGVKTIGFSRTNGYNLMRSLHRVFRDYPTCDILVNNVGGGGRWGTDPLTFNEWDEVMYKNAGVTREMTLNYLPGMMNNKFGRVITISSIYGKEAGGKPWFTMAKASQIAFMKEMSKQGYEGVTFNTISPGHIDVREPSEALAPVPMMDYPESSIKYGKPNDVADLVTFLCSNNAKHINGANIPVDGGESYSF